MSVVGATEDDGVITGTAAPAPSDGARPSDVAAPPPPPKPKIGDTRPGSPPVTKRRVRKDLVAGTETGLAGRAAAGVAPEDAGRGLRGHF